jgi:hypothetical protein
MHPRPCHLVGSIPLADADEVFMTVSRYIGSHVRRIPDGETGDRLWWAPWQRHLLVGHPQYEPEPDEAAEGGRIASQQEKKREWNGVRPPPRYRLKAGVRPEDVTFRSTGYPEAALASYERFKALRAQGIVPDGVRFQVSLPTTSAFLNAVISPPSQTLSAEPYRKRLLNDAQEICRRIPADDLAIQWDVSTEMAIWEGVRFDYLQGSKDALVDDVASHCNAIPEPGEMGIHLCYGDFGHRHWAEPKDTGSMVQLANMLFPRLTRSIQWLHMPVPRDRSDEAYFAPLKNLKRPEGCELYLGLVHLTDGEAGGRRRMQVARQFVDDFGIACECGFGRRPRETIPDLLRLHADLAREEVRT